MQWDNRTIGQLFIVIALVSLFSLHAVATPKPAYVWQELMPGFRYATYTVDVGESLRTTIHAFEVDPQQFRFDVLRAAPDNKEGETIAGLAKRHRAALAINGGFFEVDHRPIGLIVRGGKEENRLHRTSWWSIFSLRNSLPAIEPPKGYRATPETTMAIQAGPRLVIDGDIPKLKGERTARSGVGITSRNFVLVVATEGAGLTMHEFAEVFQKSRWQGGLECRNAMNLDGGSSTQLFAEIGGLSLHIPGRARIANGIGVFPK